MSACYPLSRHCACAAGLCDSPEELPGTLVFLLVWQREQLYSPLHGWVLDLNLKFEFLDDIIIAILTPVDTFRNILPLSTHVYTELAEAFS